MLLVSLVAYLLWQNISIGVSFYSYSDERVPEGLKGLRIVQISDLHNWNVKDRLLEKLIEEAPDLIFITGDLIDRRKTRVDVALDQVEEWVKIAPVFYVSGNHEELSEEFDILRSGMMNLGVHLLEDHMEDFIYHGEHVMIAGLKDPAGEMGEVDYLFDDDVDSVSKRLDLVLANRDGSFFILLSHRPELMEEYKNHEAPLVFAGHAHGGQVRLPVIGGLVAPNQGFFPRYDAGVYVEDKTTMIVSRGLGNSIFPLRIGNSPELVVVEFR
ncbi:metallophosphoesterase [Alkalibacter rhizosphaerae]|uniref:Metallophosphoesterase n=1 Tax=Alkalibacter rhizosphaerae TaxID=2815577 RepID=A0A975AHA8_9FIRM|nr:metallophosphoesterase [Alkalibacter rhizosphaerae]QSX08419.1 metallophosphoesterase [Alkalibacter rhizosphaerae]